VAETAEVEVSQSGPAGGEIPPERQKWDNVAKDIQYKRSLKQAKAQEVSDQWEGDIAVLMNRALHPENNVEYIDLNTGAVVPQGSHDAIAMPLTFSKSDLDQVQDLLDRRNQVVTTIADLLDPLKEDTDPAYVAHQADMAKGQLAEISLQLYEILTADPRITVEWLEMHPTAWSPQDLGRLVGRFEQRNLEVVAQIGRFRSKRRR
jgi:hypothetical protein